MAERRVTALIYRVLHGTDVHYGNSRLEVDTPDFKISVANELARFELKYVFTDVRTAQAVIEPYARLWEFQASIERGPGVFALAYDTAEYDSPEPVRLPAVKLSLSGKVVSPKNYPEPPDGMADDDLSRLVRTYRRVRPAIGGVNYTPPSGNAVDFNFEKGGYVPPAGNAVNFNFGEQPPVRSLRLGPESANQPREASQLDDEPPVPTLNLPSDWDIVRSQILDRLDTLERAFREALPLVEAVASARRGIGDNNPPEPIGADGFVMPGTASDVAAGIRAIGDLRAQLGLGKPDDSALVLISTWAIQRGCNVVLASLRWLRDNKANFGKGTVIGVGTQFGKWVWDEAAHPERVAALIHQIHAVGSEVITTLMRLF